MDKELFEKALKLAPNERLAFAELILASLEHEEDEVRNAWMKEVKDRMNAVNEGKSKLLDFENIENLGIGNQE
jgi:putative addiction module component (TIGR02574 family)